MQQTEDKNTFELIVSMMLFQLIWIVSTTQDPAQSFAMGILLSLIAMVVLIRFVATMATQDIKNKATVFSRNSDLLIFSFIGILTGISGFMPNSVLYALVKNWSWMVAILMAGGMAIRLMLTYNFLKPFEARTEVKQNAVRSEKLADNQL